VPATLSFDASEVGKVGGDHAGSMRKCDRRDGNIEIIDQLTLFAGP
jgi:hypothetical protein